MLCTCTCQCSKKVRWHDIQDRWLNRECFFQRDFRLLLSTRFDDCQWEMKRYIKAYFQGRCGFQLNPNRITTVKKTDRTFFLFFIEQHRLTDPVSLGKWISVSYRDTRSLMWPIRFRNYLFFSLAHLPSSFFSLSLVYVVVCVCVCMRVCVSECVPCPKQKKSIEHNLSKLIGKSQLR